MLDLDRSSRRVNGRADEPGMVGQGSLSNSSCCVIFANQDKLGPRALGSWLSSLGRDTGTQLDGPVIVEMIKDGRPRPCSSEAELLLLTDEIHSR